MASLGVALIASARAVTGMTSAVLVFCCVIVIVPLRTLPARRGPRRRTAGRSQAGARAGAASRSNAGYPKQRH